MEYYFLWNKVRDFWIAGGGGRFIFQEDFTEDEIPHVECVTHLFFWIGMFNVEREYANALNMKEIPEKFEILSWFAYEDEKDFLGDLTVEMLG